MTIEAKIRVMQLQSKGYLKAPIVKEDKEGFSPRTSGGSVALLTLGFQTSGLQNTA